MTKKKDWWPDAKIVLEFIVASILAFFVTTTIPDQYRAFTQVTIFLLINIYWSSSR